MATRSRQSVLADEERFEHEVGLNKKEQEKKLTKPKVEKTEFVVSGKKMLKKETKGGRVYTSYLGRTDKNKELYKKLKDKGLLT